MKKVLIIIIPVIIAALVLGAFIFFIGGNSGKGALQVTATPTANVYLNNQLIGQTPLCKCDPKDMLSVGQYTIRLVPQQSGFTAFEEKISITKSVLTVVDRSFGGSGTSAGSVITLTPLSDKEKTELLIVSIPEKADVFLDNSKSGVTPLLMTDVTDSDHEIRLSKEGYLEKSVRIRTVKGYKLSSTIYLGVNTQPTIALPSPSATPAAAKADVTILSTPTGFLRVRESPSLTAREIFRVNPGEKYELLEEQEDWYRIKLTDGSGWISSQYASKN